MESNHSGQGRRGRLECCWTAGRLSEFGCCPFAVLICRGNHSLLRRGNETFKILGHPLEVLGQLLAENLQRSGITTPLGQGAAIGYLSYDLGRFVEEMPVQAADDLHLPDILLYFFDALLVHDHERGETSAICANSLGAQARLEETLECVEAAGQLMGSGHPLQIRWSLGEAPSTGLATTRLLSE